MRSKARVILSRALVAAATLMILCLLVGLAFWMKMSIPELGQDTHSSSIRPPVSRTEKETRKPHNPEVGLASWYSLNGKTASGEPMHPNDMTAAHRSLPLGTHVWVQNLESGRSVDVRINDRGPFAKNRVIDLSKSAAERLGITESGTSTVILRTTD